MILFLLMVRALSHIIGIDLGTTYSVVSVCRNGSVEIIPDDTDSTKVASVVSYHRGSRYVGDTAVKLRTIVPEETVFAIKRIIGKRFSDDAVQKEIKRVPYHIVDVEDHPYVKIMQENEELVVSPEEISGLILTKLKNMAANYLKQSITEAVITVPAYFNEEQRKATMIAGEIAGLKVRRIISEPTSAALAYGLDRKGDKYVVVFDLGGGTFDVSLLAMEEGFFEVISTVGDTSLGGEDFDETCVEEMVRRFGIKTGRDPSRDRNALSHLKKACERAKIELSTVEETLIEIPLFYDNIDLKEKFTIDEFNKLNMHLFQKTIDILGSVFTNDVKPTDIYDVVMIGGSSRIPMIRKLVSDFFGGKELCIDINPDEAVASGAAIQGSIIENSSNELVVVDVYPLTLGIETVGGLMSPIINRNTKIPVKRSKLFIPHNDDAAGARIGIYEGERKFVRDCRSLGVFELHQLPRARREMLQIEITFEIDANAILKVTAQELSTKKTESLEIDTLEFSISQSQIDEAIESAALFAEADEQDRQRVIARIDYEISISNIMRTLKSDKQLYNKEKYREFKNKLKLRQKWLEENPMEEPEVYRSKCEEIRAEFAFLYQIPSISSEL